MNNLWMKLDRHKTIFGIVLVIILYLLMVSYVYNFTVDDTFISLRYADNLANHGQLSFNLGEQPTEGYTNFLLILIEAVFVKLGVTNAAAIPKLTGILSGCLTIIFVFKIANMLLEEKHHLLAYLGAVAIATSTPFIIWTVGGLETTLFTSLITAGTYFFLASLKDNSFKMHLCADLFFFVGVLCRPEGLLFWGLTYLYILVDFKNTKLPLRARSLGMFLLALSAYLLWKYSYFGGIIPLTYYAKKPPFSILTFIGGLKRFSYLLKTNNNLLFLFAFFIAVVSSVIKKNKRLQYLIIQAIAFAVYLISRGYQVSMDDTFRLWVPLLPFLYLAGTIGLLYCIEYIPRSFRITKVVLVMLCLIQIFVGVTDLNFAWNTDRNFGSRWRAGLQPAKTATDEFNRSLPVFGKWLKDNAPPGATVVMSDIGAVPYYSKLKVIDVWSLVDKKIVMLKRDRYTSDQETVNSANASILDYIFSKNPEIIVQGLDTGLKNDPRFLSNYLTLTKISFNYWGYPYYIAVRKDLAQHFERYGPAETVLKSPDE